MTTERVDQINVGLVLLALMVAIFLPFELFLFSYAFLGPLHYLTEITWLQKRRFFVRDNRNWIWILVLTTLLLSLNSFFGILHLPGLQETGNILAAHTSHLLLAMFIFAISLVVVRRMGYILLAIPTSLILSWLLHDVIPLSNVIIGSFLPTLIHVYIFTMFFMAFGVLKSRSRYGYLGIIAMALVPLVIFFLQINPENYQLVGKTAEAYTRSKFGLLNARLAGTFGWIEGKDFDLVSRLGIKIQIFVAFAYTYHYLNWFSKTSVIGWKQALNRRSTLLILVVWLGAAGLYIYDYTIGLTALFFLSFLHVLLEFPLNVMTIREVLAAPWKQGQKA